MTVEQVVAVVIQDATLAQAIRAGLAAANGPSTENPVATRADIPVYFRDNELYFTAGGSEYKIRATLVTSGSTSTFDATFDTTFS